MADGETCGDNIVNGGKKWPGYCKTFIVKEPNGSIKELVFPKALDLDRPKRDRTTFSNRQLQQLEDEFKSNQYIVGKDRTKLAKSLGLTETQVKVWFQNRRTKLKKDNERKDSFRDPQAESKAAQNVLKLLSYSGAGGGFIPTFHGKQPQVADLSTASSLPETETSHEQRSAVALERQRASPTEACLTQAYLHQNGFNDSPAGNAMGAAVQAHALFPIKIPHPFNKPAMNPATVSGHLSFQENTSPARISHETRDEEHGHLTGYQLEVPINQTTFESSNSIDNSALLDQYAERSAYFGQQEPALSAFARLPPWFGDYQRLNALNRTGAHWLQNNRHASHFGAQQSLQSLPPTGSLQQHKNIHTDLLHHGPIRQQMPNPEGFIWGYIQPPHEKRFNFPNHFSY